MSEPSKDKDEKEPKEAKEVLTKAKKRMKRRISKVDKKKLQKRGLTMIQRQMHMLMDKSLDKLFDRQDVESLAKYMALLDNYIELDELRQLEKNGKEPKENT
jgi:hypothetical protein